MKQEELEFLLGRELCRIANKHTYHTTMLYELLEAVETQKGIVGVDTLSKSWKTIMYKWSRLSNYSADNFGYGACGSISSAVGRSTY